MHQSLFAASLVSLVALAAGCSGGSHSGWMPDPQASVATSGAQASSVATPPARPTPPRTPAPQGPFPIVLVHGAGGFAKFGVTDYFFEVPAMLRGQGATVLVVSVSSVNTIAVRAQQLRDQIDRAFPTGKVNLICHSMGGLDARHMITHMGMADRVASLSTIGTPHHGTPLADATLTMTPGNIASSADVLLNVVGLDWGCLNDLSVAWVNGVFNPSTPDDPRVYYQSWAGIADPAGKTGYKLNPVMLPGWWLIKQNAGGGENDGVVPTDSARWTNFRGVLPADHMAEIGAPFGAVKFAHKQFYTTLVNELRLRGF